MRLRWLWYGDGYVDGNRLGDGWTLMAMLMLSILESASTGQSGSTHDGSSRFMLIPFLHMRTSMIPYRAG